MEPVNTQQYFQDNIFKESLLLEYLRDVKLQTVTLVCDYAHDVVMAVLQGKKPPLMQGGEIYHKDFRKLVFLGVREYKRKAGPFKQLQDYSDNFHARDHVPDIVIESLQVIPTTHPEKLEAQISFVNFGHSTFSFTHFQAERKLVRSLGKRTDAEAWDYVDIVTRQQVDFDDPFKTS